MYIQTMKTNLKVITLFLTSTLMIACGGIHVSRDYETTTDFSTLKTYHWNADFLTAEKQTKDNDPLLNSRIHSAIDRKLSSKGYILSTKTNTDFIVSYQTETRQRLTTDGSSSNVSFGFSSFGNFGAVGLGTGNTVRDEDEATLIINIIDAKENKLLWRGTTRRYVYPHKDPSDLTNLINAHVDAILDLFPPLIKAAK